MTQNMQPPTSNVAQSLAAVSARLAGTGPARNARSTADANAGKAEPGEGRRAPAGARQTKTASVEKLLQRKAGATIEQIGKATGWQSHTCRAFLTGLRRKGREVIRDTNAGGKSVYRISPAPTETPAPTATDKQAS